MTEKEEVILDNNGIGLIESENIPPWARNEACL